MRLLTAGSLVRVQLGEPRRSKLCIACSDFFQKSERRAHAAALFSDLNPLAELQIGFMCAETSIYSIPLLQDGQSLNLKYVFINEVAGFVANRKKTMSFIHCLFSISYPERYKTKYIVFIVDLQFPALLPHMPYSL